MSSSFMLEVSTALSNTFGDTHKFVAQFIPFMDNQIIFAVSLGTFLVVPILFFLLTMDWQSNTPPRLPLLLPALLGHYRLKSEGPLELVRQGYKKFGDIFRIKIGRQGFTFLIGSEAGSVLFEASDRDLTQKEVYSFTVPVFGKNIVYDADPNVMAQQLKFTRHGLTGNSMREHAPKIVRETEEFFAKWGDSGIIDLKDALSELTVLTAARCLLGKEIREKLYSRVAEQYQYLNDGMTHVSVFWPYAPTKAHRLRDSARREIATIFAGVIENRRKEMAEGKPKQDDFLQVLMDAEYRDGSSPSTEEITGLLLAALFAGQHTSSITSTWVGLRIIDKWRALVPRLLEEQKRVLAEHDDGKLNFDALNQMDLLHLCVKETLRLYPPIIMIMRYVQNALQYRGYSIPKGDIVVACPPVTHRLPEIYANPEEFDPDRFLPPRNEGNLKNTFLSFGGGRHACLGEKFGFLQIKAIWSVLLRNFDFELVDPVPRVDYSALVVGPMQPCRVRYTRKPKTREFDATL